MDLDDFFYERNKERSDKESVYEQWRKVMTIHVVGEEINRNDREPITLNMEQLRTVFNNGYKFAMLQNLQSIKAVLRTLEDTKNSDLSLLQVQVEDRLLTCDCIETHKSDTRKLSKLDAYKRREEFSRYESEDLSSWGFKKM